MKDFPEFGKVIEENPQGSFPEFGKRVDEIPKWKSVANAYAKGAINKAGDIVELLQKLPLPKGPVKGSDIRDFAENHFLHGSGEAEKIASRAGGLTTESLLSPGGLVTKLVQIGAGTALGYGVSKARELLPEIPEWTETLAETAPFLFSGKKTIPLKKSQKPFVDFLRKNGLSENEITPLIKTPQQLERWSKYASKGSKSKELMESIYHKTGNIYDSIEQTAKTLPSLNNQMKTQVLNDFTKILNSMPDKYRKLIKADLEDLVFKGRGGFEDFMNFYKDVNAVIGPEKGGRAIVGQFKEPIVKAMKSIDPALAEDFKLATDLYRTRSYVKGHLLSKQDFDKLMDIGEAFGLGAGIYNRDVGKIATVVGAIGARKIAREMLINPRIQNISVRIGEALRKNKYSLAEKYLTQFSDIIETKDPELASTIRSTASK